MNILLTGAAGRLGEHACAVLTAAGHTVTATDIKPAKNPGPLPIVRCNLLDRQAALALAAGHDAVVHLAAHPRPDGRPDPVRTHLENITMMAHVLEAATQVGARKFIYASSIQVILGALTNRGKLSLPPAMLPLDGDVPPRPENLYALSKQVGENMLRQAADAHPLEAVALRFPLCANDLEATRTWLKLDPTKPVHDGLVAVITYREAARVIAAVLAATLPGYRCYLPSLPANALGLPTADVMPCLRHLALRDPAYPPDVLVDTTRLRRETGWAPEATS